MSAREIAYRLLQKEGSAARTFLKGLGAAGKGFFQSGKLMSKHMAEAGIKSPLAHGIAKIAPYATAGLGAKALYDSPTGQRVRYKVQEIRARRAMKRAQEQGGGY